MRARTCSSAHSQEPQPGEQPERVLHVEEDPRPQGNEPRRPRRVRGAGGHPEERPLAVSDPGDLLGSGGRAHGIERRRDVLPQVVVEVPAARCGGAGGSGRVPRRSRAKQSKPARERWAASDQRSSPKSRLSRLAAMPCTSRTGTPRAGRADGAARGRSSSHRRSPRRGARPRRAASGTATSRTRSAPRWRARGRRPPGGDG